MTTAVTTAAPTGASTEGAAVREMTRSLRLLVGRAVEALLVVVALASLVFFALRLLPGDPARLVLGDEASAAELARVRAVLHLDEPLLAQYARFLRGLATLDLGDSFRRPGTSAHGARRRRARRRPRSWRRSPWASARLLGVAAAVAASGPWLSPRGRRLGGARARRRGGGAARGLRAGGDVGARGAPAPRPSAGRSRRGAGGARLRERPLVPAAGRPRGADRARVARRRRARAVPHGGAGRRARLPRGCGSCTRCRRSSARS